MSEDILSQEEIDALLTGVDDGDIDTSAASGSPDCSAYDLASQDKLVRSRLPTLEVINERLSRHLRLALFAMLKRSVEVEAEAIRIQKYSEYVDALSTPASLTVVRMHPLRGSALMVMEQSLVVKLVDLFFGGEGHEPRHEERDFTATEYRVLEIFYQHAVEGLVEAWSKVIALQVEKTGSELSPDMVSIAAPVDPVIVNAYKFEFDGFSGEFQLLMPYIMIDPVKEALTTTSKASNDRPEAAWSAAIRQNIANANVSLGCTITEREISLRDVIALKEGDVIPVEIPPSHVLEANGAPVFKVKLGKSRGNLALEVVGKTSRG